MVLYTKLEFSKKYPSFFFAINLHIIYYDLLLTFSFDFRVQQLSRSGFAL